LFPNSAFVIKYVGEVLVVDANERLPQIAQARGPNLSHLVDHERTKLEAELGPLNRPSTYIKTIKIALLPPTQPTVSAPLRGKSYWDDKMELVIDARTYGNEIRFINHSCRLNCASYDFGWANTSRLGIFAVRDISPIYHLASTTSLLSQHYTAPASTNSSLAMLSIVQVTSPILSYTPPLLAAETRRLPSARRSSN
ncbi:SET domain-containing protein, partial [Phytophthora infestans]